MLDNFTTGLNSLPIQRPWLFQTDSTLIDAQFIFSADGILPSQRTPYSKYHQIELFTVNLLWLAFKNVPKWPLELPPIYIRIFYEKSSWLLPLNRLVAVDTGKFELARRNHIDRYAYAMTLMKKPAGYCSRTGWLRSVPVNLNSQVEILSIDMHMSRVTEGLNEKRVFLANSCEIRDVLHLGSPISRKILIRGPLFFALSR